MRGCVAGRRDGGWAGGWGREEEGAGYDGTIGVLDRLTTRIGLAPFTLAKTCMYTGKLPARATQGTIGGTGR